MFLKIVTKLAGSILSCNHSKANKIKLLRYVHLYRRHSSMCSLSSHTTVNDTGGARNRHGTHILDYQTSVVQDMSTIQLHLSAGAFPLMRSGGCTCIASAVYSLMVTRCIFAKGHLEVQLVPSIFANSPFISALCTCLCIHAIFMLPSSVPFTKMNDNKTTIAAEHHSSEGKGDE